MESSIFFICSFTSLIVSVIAFSIAVRTYKSVIKNKQYFNLQRIKSYNRRQHEYVKQVFAKKLF